MTLRRKNNHPEFLRRLKRAQSAGLSVAGERAKSLIQLAVNTSAGPTYVKVKRITPRGNKRTRTVYANPSKPGNPPHKRTGNLQRNIFHRHVLSRIVSQVGWRANGIYGYFHEVGIQYGRRGKQKRPHLLPTIKKNRTVLARLFAATAKRYLS